MKSRLSKIKRNFSHNIKFYLPRSKKKSIFFFTFHKCASTLFSSYVLKNIKGLHLIDYEKHFADKPNSFKPKLNFQENGFLYGPIRLSSRDKLVYNSLILPTSDPDFIKDKTAIFFIRDPRDILISAYYSFGFTHGLNSVKEKREEQLKDRKTIQSMSIDEYALEYANLRAEDFNNLKTIAQTCNKSVILRYEDMVENFDSFIKKLRSIVDIDDETVQIVYQKSRPKKSLDNTSHKRSGETRMYLKELKRDTIKTLNCKLDPILRHFNYMQ